MKIAILSDVHIGFEAKSQDLCPIGLVKKCDRARFRTRPTNYISEFIKFLKSNKISADYLFVPGDVTDAGHPVAVELASEFLEKVRLALGVKRPKMVFVPGNHDVDWGMQDKKDTTGIKWGLRYAAFQSPRYIFSAINKRGTGDLWNGGFFKIWNFPEMLVLGYNTSSTDRPDFEPHAGEIVEQHLKMIGKQLSSRAINDTDRLRICLLHHHLKNYSWPTGTGQDFSAAQGGNNMIAFLEQYNFDLIVHGHRHYSFLDAKFGDIPILCAGSFSAQVSSVWEGAVLNQFHLVDVSKDPSSGRARGIIRSWSNTMTGWVESEERNGSYTIGYERGFGLSLQDEDVAKKVERKMRAYVKHNEDFWWRRNIVPSIPELAYLVETTMEVITWCEKNCIDARRWEVFPAKGDIVFMRKKGGRK